MNKKGNLKLIGLSVTNVMKRCNFIGIFEDDLCLIQKDENDNLVSTWRHFTLANENKTEHQIIKNKNNRKIILVAFDYAQALTKFKPGDTLEIKTYETDWTTPKELRDSKKEAVYFLDEIKKMWDPVAKKWLEN